MPTLKTLFWLIAAATFYLIAWNVGSGWLYILSAVMVAVPVASLLMGRFNTRGLSVTQKTEAQSVQGDDLLSQLTIRNGSRWPRFLLRLDVTLAGSSSSIFLPYIPGRGKQEAGLTLYDLDRGIYSGSEILVSSSAPFGMAKSRRRLPVSSPLVVYPRWEDLLLDWHAGSKDTGYMTTSAMPTRRSASDYLGVREYRAGDSPRSIHWRTTARTGKLAVIEYARPASTTPVVILDTYTEANTRGGRIGSFESAVSLAASVIQREAARNRRYGFGASLADAIDRGLGNLSEPAMRWLAQVRAVERKPLDLDVENLPWADATPVLVLTNHKAYSRIHLSGLISNFPHTVVIMLEGRGFAPRGRSSKNLMQPEAIELLAESIEAAGGRFILVPSAEEARACLESL